MYCRIYKLDQVVIPHRSTVKEMYFIKMGIVEVFNSETDEIENNKPILYLPKYSYFGDYQILYNLKSNLRFKTIKKFPEDLRGPLQDQLIYFMCVKAEKLNEFCELFPQTAENIKRKALERRRRFLQQRACNSKKFKNQITEDMSSLVQDNDALVFESDEEYEGSQS